MIRSEIWTPGTNPVLDDLFEKLRVAQNADTTHPLHANYNAQAFQECTALTITFDNDEPICCSGILQRSCWPATAYRILNRLWKVGDERLTVLNTHDRMRRVSDSVKSQLEYAFTKLNAELVFISRHQENWQRFMITSVERNTGIHFSHDSFNYQTCTTPNDNTCWQKIIYYGDDALLKQWSRT